GKARCDRLPVNLSLDRIKLADPLERLLRDRRCGRLEHIVKLAPGMRPTGGMDQPRRSSAGCRRSCQGFVPTEGIGLDHAAKAGEMIARPLTPAIWAEAVIGGWHSCPLPGPLV